MKQNYSDTRQHLLDTGHLMMVVKGFTGVGLNEILQTAGVPKGSFYHYFASKEDFALQALEFIYQPRLQRYAEALSNPALSPRQRILSYYGELLAHFRQQERLEYHCFIGSLSFEMSELLPAIGQQVEAVLQQSALTLQHCLEQAQQAGELAADEDCANLAAFIANAWQGVLTRLKVGSQTQPVEEFVQRLERLLTA